MVTTKTFPRGTARKLAYNLTFKLFQAVVLIALIRMEQIISAKIFLIFQLLYDMYPFFNYNFSPQRSRGRWGTRPPFPEYKLGALLLN
jgi:hypothetical protein